MTPKDKAGQLVQKYAIRLPLENYGRVDKTSGLVILDYNIDLAKQCALIAVDEQIELLLNLSPYIAFPEQVKHLQEVKQEIQKLLHRKIKQKI